MSGDSLFDDVDPLDDPLWREAVRRESEGRPSRPSADHVNCPKSWLGLVLPLVKGERQLAAALLIYPRLRWDKAVPIPNSELDGFGISRDVKYRTLAKLERAGLISVERPSRSALRVRLKGWD